MSLKEILGLVEGLATEVMNIVPEKIVIPLDSPNSRGVYLFYKKDKVIYVGQGGHLRKRLNQHLLDSENAGKSAFRRALDRDFGIKPKETKFWILRNCRLVTKEIENADICKLVESLLIAHYRTINTELLNR